MPASASVRLAALAVSASLLAPAAATKLSREVRVHPQPVNGQFIIPAKSVHPQPVNGQFIIPAKYVTPSADASPAGQPPVLILQGEKVNRDYNADYRHTRATSNFEWGSDAFETGAKPRKTSEGHSRRSDVVEHLVCILDPF